LGVFKTTNFFLKNFNMGVKLKNWRHNTKVKQGIQRGDTPEMVRARVGTRRFSNYHPDDLDALLNN